MADFKLDRWINGHGVFSGHETYVRKNISLQTTRKADYPHVLLVSLIYQEQGASGLPSSEVELQRLDNSEEAIADRICSRYGALYALCVSRDETRDLLFFPHVSPTDEAIAAEVAACSPSVDYDFGMRQDPAWRPYVTMLPDSPAGAPAAPPQKSWWRRLLGS